MVSGQPEKSCSFCRRVPDPDEALFENSEARICVGCLDLCDELLADDVAGVWSGPTVAFQVGSPPRVLGHKFELVRSHLRRSISCRIVLWSSGGQESLARELLLQMRAEVCAADGDLVEERNAGNGVLVAVATPHNGTKSERGDLAEDFELLRRWGIPGVDLGRLDLESEITRLVPADLAWECGAVPVHRGKDMLIVALAVPTDETAIIRLKEVTGMDVEVVAASPEAIQAALRRYYPPIAIAPDR
jgi:hypothetical protein